MTVLVKVPGVFKSIITGRLYSLGVPSACKKINDHNLLSVYADKYLLVFILKAWCIYTISNCEPLLVNSAIAGFLSRVIVDSNNTDSNNERQVSDQTPRS